MGSEKIAFITGAAKGIGRAIARQLIAEEYRVVVADLAGAAEAASELADARKCIGVTCDVTDPRQVELAVARCVDAFGALTCLVNNAGLYASLVPGPFDKQTPEQWRQVFEVNVVGVFNACRAAVPQMRKQGGGSIVMINSGVPFTGLPNLLHYVSSKGAILAMTRALASELGSDNIRVNGVAPGFTLSDGVTENASNFEGLRELAVRTRALGRDQTPSDIVGAVSFFCGDSSAFVTGQTLVVDGGRYFH